MVSSLNWTFSLQENHSYCSIPTKLADKKKTFLTLLQWQPHFFWTSSEIMIGFMQFLEITYLVINGLLV